jgi:hypothetical protein
MTIKATTFLVIFIHVAFIVSAQNDSTPVKTKRYFNTFQSGGLFGEKDKGTSFTFSTIHGAQFGPVRVGLGTGFDSYQRWRALPVYSFTSFDFVKIKSNALFVSCAIGYSKAWYREQYDYEPKYSSGEGIVVNPLVGYRITADKWRIYVSTGYKFQRVNYSRTSDYYSWSSVPNTSRYSVQEDINRIVFQIGFGFN